MLRRSMMLALGTLALSAAPAGAATFTNPAPITIPISGETFVNASPYPSDIAVSGVSGSVTDVNVRLNGFSHSFPDDVGIVLVGPGGALMLLSGATNVGTPQPASNLSITFDDSAAGFAPNDSALASTSYKPTNNHVFADNFPAPGPGTAYSDPGPMSGGTATLVSTFGGTAANGTWSLFVRDFLGTSQGGLIAGGWSLDFPNPVVAPVPKAKKCKKAKKKGKKGAAAPSGAQAAKGCKKKKRKRR